MRIKNILSKFSKTNKKHITEDQTNQQNQPNQQEVTLTEAKTEKTEPSTKNMAKKSLALKKVIVITIMVFVVSIFVLYLMKPTPKKNDNSVAVFNLESPPPQLQEPQMQEETPKQEEASVDTSNNLTQTLPTPSMPPVADKSLETERKTPESGQKIVLNEKKEEVKKETNKVTIVEKNPFKADFLKKFESKMKQKQQNTQVPLHQTLDMFKKELTVINDQRDRQDRKLQNGQNAVSDIPEKPALNLIIYGIFDLSGKWTAITNMGMLNEGSMVDSFVVQKIDISSVLLFDRQNNEYLMVNVTGGRNRVNNTDNSNNISNNNTTKDLVTADFLRGARR